MIEYLAGGMTGADIAIGWVDSSGHVTIQVDDFFSDLYFYLSSFNFVLGSTCIQWIEADYWYDNSRLVCSSRSRIKWMDNDSI